MTDSPDRTRRARRVAVVLASASALAALAAFTSLRAAAKAPAAATARPAALSADTAPTPVTRVWPAMGSVLQISAWDADTARALVAFAVAHAAVQRVDSLTWPDRPGSEVAALHRRAGTGEPTTVSPWTADVLDAALALARASDGALALTAAGGGRTAPRTVRASAAAGAGADPVRFDRATRTVRLTARGTRLDVGGMATGFALDRAAEALRAAGVPGAIVDIGGAFRVVGRAPVGARWNVALQNPFAPGEVFAAVQMDAGALSTTGDAAERFAADGAPRPRDPDASARAPKPGVASVSVIAPSEMLAAGLSRALFGMSPEAGCRFVARYPGVDAVWVRAPDDDEGEAEEARDADDGVEPHLVVFTDGLAGRLELLSEEPEEEQPVRCGALLARSGGAAPRPRSR